MTPFYASYPTFLDAVLAEEPGWLELSVPAMSMIVFRHEDLMEFSMESLEFIAQEKRRSTMTESAMNPGERRMNLYEPSKANTNAMLRLFVYGTLNRRRLPQIQKNV